MSRQPSRGRRTSRSSRPKRYGGTRKATLEERFANDVRAMDERARTRFSREPLPMGIPAGSEEPRSFSFEWALSPVSLSAEEKVAEVVVRRGEFGWVEDERLEEIETFVEQHAMSLEQALSLRSALLQQKTVYSHGKLKSKAGKMAAHYRAGSTIIELSKDNDFPPMNVFRAVLEANGWSKNKIKESLRAPSSMKERERKEFEAAEAADRVTNVDQTETHERADLFEEILADWFEAQGVRIRRQPEMVKEQQKEHGRPIRTPDILFLDHVTINGSPVAWIDAKHFYGADVDFQRKKTKKQMTRYMDEWGSGAIVYRHGFSENLFIPGVSMLDAGPLDLTKLDSPE
ncbi:MAG: C15orf41 family protein [Candidatus Poseidonia sp.]|nr:C15orf41 family protein [Poseidonia sp.]